MFTNQSSISSTTVILVSSLGELDDFPTEIQEGATAFRPIIFNPVLNNTFNSKFKVRGDKTTYRRKTLYV